MLLAENSQLMYSEKNTIQFGWTVMIKRNLQNCVSLFHLCFIFKKVKSQVSENFMGHAKSFS